MGLPHGALEPMQPWMAELVLASTVFARQGASGSDGVETVLSRSAPATARRRAFETASEQIALFADTPLPDQIASLEETLDEVAEGPAAYDKLVKAWTADEVKALEKTALDPVRRASPRLFARLISERNARWTQVLAERMKGSGETVVVVGAGHLLGPGGVPARLRALGFQVEGP